MRLQTPNRRLLTRQSDRCGATAVEFVIVSPIFFLLLFAALEFATVGTIRSTANNAAYEAARMIVVPGANRQQGIDEAERIMAIVGVRYLTVNVTPAVIDETTQDITVDIGIPYAQNAVFTPWFVGNVNIRSTCTLKAERYDGS